MNALSSHLGSKNAPSIPSADVKKVLVFDSERQELYALASLNDLAGVRVLAFPSSLLAEADRALRNRFPSWKPDPVPGYDDEPLALKCFGYCEASDKIRAEFQIVPMLTALFWEIEHFRDL